MPNTAEFTIARLETRVKNLKKQLKETQNELKDVRILAESLNGENEKLKNKLKRHEAPAGHYSHSWSWISKIVFLVKQAAKPLRSAEIIEVLQKKEGVYFKLCQPTLCVLPAPAGAGRTHRVKNFIASAASYPPR